MRSFKEEARMAEDAVALSSEPKRRFEKHLFISCAHLDNEPLQPEKPGWITRLHGSLKAVLGTRLGKNAEIWRDEKLRGNDIFGQEILDQFPKTALLLSVVSPSAKRQETCSNTSRFSFIVPRRFHVTLHVLLVPHGSGGRAR